jgi:hypothetical protein
MADLIYPPDYAAQIAQAANIPAEQAEAYSRAQLAQQQAQQFQLANIKASLQLPLVRQAVQQAGTPEDFGSYIGMPSAGTPNAPMPVPNMGQSGVAAAATPTGYQQYSQNEPQGTMTTANQPAPQQYPDGNALTGDQIGQVRAQMSQLSQQQFAPLPSDMPPQVAQKVYAYRAAGLDNLAEGEIQKWNAYIGRVNQQRQFNANEAYQTALSVHSAYTNGNDPYAMLAHLEPQLAQSLKGATPEQIDDLAQHMGGELFRYTGRPVKVHDDGYFYDEQSGKRVLGDTDRVTLSPKEQEQIWTEVNAPTDYFVNGQPAKVPWWQTVHAPNAMTAYHDRILAANQATTPGPAAPANTSATAGPGQPQVPAAPAGGTAPPPNPQQGAPPIRPTPGAIAPPSGPGRSSQGALQSANSATGAVDPHDFQPMPQLMPTGTQGIGPGPLMDKTQAQVLAAQTQNAQQYNQLSAAATGNLTRDQQLLRLVPKSAFGPGTEMGADFQTFLKSFDDKNNMTWSQFMQDPTAYQLLVKNMGVGNLTEFNKEMQESGGGSMRMGAQFTNLILGRLAPNTELTRSAVKTMLQWDIANNTYDLQKVRDYNQLGGKVNPVGWDSAYTSNPKYSQQNAFPRYLKQMDDYGNIAPKGAKPANQRQLDWLYQHQGEPGAIRAFKNKMNYLPSGF